MGAAAVPGVALASGVSPRFLGRVRGHFHAGCCRQVIDVSGDCSREHLQAPNGQFCVALSFWRRVFTAVVRNQALRLIFGRK